MTHHEKNQLAIAASEDGGHQLRKFRQLEKVEKVRKQIFLYNFEGTQPYDTFHLAH